MANINCPFIGDWTIGANSYTFNTSGTISVNGTDTYKFLVWEVNADHKLVTSAISNGTIAVYDFTVNTGGTIVVTGVGLPLAGTLSPDGGNTPAPLNLISSINPFLNQWIAPVTAAGSPNPNPTGTWDMAFAPEGIVMAHHRQMNMTYTNAYLVNTARNQLVILGQRRFASVIAATYAAAGTGYTVTETPSTGNIVWAYSPGPTS